MAALVFSVVLSAILARSLPAGDFAFYGVLSSVLAVAVVLAQGGYQTGVVKSVAGALADETGDTGAGVYLSAALLATAIGSGLVAVLAYMFAGALLPEVGGHPIEGVELFLVLLMIPLMGGNVLLAEALRGAGRIGWAASMTGLGQYGGLVRTVLLTLSAGLFAILGWLNLRELLILSVVSSGLVIVIIAIFIRCSFRWSLQVGLGWQEMRRSLPLNFRFLVGQFTQLLSGHYIVALVSGMVFSGQVLAAFVAAQSLRVLLQAPHMLFASAIPSLMIEAHKRSDKVALEDLLRFGSSIAFAMTLAITFPFIVMGPWIFRLIFGADYGGAYLPFLAIAPGLIGMTFGGTAARALLLLGQERLYLFIAIGAAAIALPFYFLSAQLFGTIGLGLASSVILAGQQLVAVIAVRRTLGVRSSAHLDPTYYLSMISRAKGWTFGGKRAL